MPKRTKKTDLPPSVDELDENINKAIEDLDTESSEEDLSFDESEQEEEKTEETPEETEEETPEEEQEEEQEEEKTEDNHDYKKRYSDSSREAMKLHAKNRKITSAVKEASEIETPSDAEMKTLYGEDWDLMGTFEKKMAKDNELNNRRFELVKKASAEGDKIEKWNEQVTEFTQNPKSLIEYPDLEGKLDDFEAFATKNEHNSIPFDILVGAFLHQSKSSATKNKGKMFETGSAGSTKPERKAGYVSFEEGQQLRVTNYKKYKELLVAGRIEDPKL